MSLENTFFLVFAFIFGAVVGSFLNVCIYRIPAEKSIVSPPSSCPACDHQIRWFENIPIVSYLLLRGHCSACQIKISARYPAVEALTGALFILSFYYFGFSAATIVYLIFVAALVVITFIDLDHQIIPDVISLPGILVGFAGSFLVPWLTWYDSIFGVLLGGGSLLAVAWGYEKLTGREGMGGGTLNCWPCSGLFWGGRRYFRLFFWRRWLVHWLACR